MSFVPALPVTGVAGLRFLDRTYESQLAAFGQSGYVNRAVESFTARIASVESAAELVADRTLLEVALGAFGLEDELPKKAFLRKILEEGSGSDSFATRLADNRFAQFSRAFGFGDPGGARTADPGFASSIANSYLERAFERGVGAQDETLRLALNFRREVVTIANGPAVESAGWFQVLGQAPLRAVVEGAFQLGSGFSQLPLDRQVEELTSRTRALTGNGSAATFAEEGAREALIARFLAISNTGQASSAATAQSVALQLLSGGGAGLPNLLISRAQI
jgi:hypothetical protein